MKHSPAIHTKLLIFIGLIFLLQNGVSAQQMIVVPDTKDLFTDAIEVLDAQVKYANGNDLERELWTYLQDSGTWVSFDYPEAFEDVLLAEVNPDGTITLTVKEIGGAADQQVLWWLDTANGIFSRYENACKDYDNRLDETTQPHWVLHKDEKINRIALCFSGTGQSEYLLPKDLRWYDILETPNPEWLILFGWSPDLRSANQGEMYSYHIPTHKLIHVGDVYNAGIFQLDRWISPTEGIWRLGSMPESFPKTYHYFDLSVANSFEEVVDGRANFFDTPSRYDYLQTFYEVVHRADPHYAPPCEITTFDLETRISGTYALGADCYGRVLRVNSSYYYVSYPDDMTNSGLSLYRYDMTQDAKTALIHMEDLVALEDISPDGRYLLLMVNDGTFPELRPISISNSPLHHPPVQDLDPFYHDYFVLKGARLGFYDLKLQRWASKPARWTFGDAASGIIGNPQWIDDTHFYVQTETEAIAFSLGETGLTEISRIKGRIKPSPDKNYALIWNEDNTLEVVNLLSGSRRLLATFPKGFPPYSPSLEWVGQDEVEIDDMIRFDESYDKWLTMTYHIRILDTE